MPTPIDRAEFLSHLQTVTAGTRAAIDEILSAVDDDPSLAVRFNSNPKDDAMLVDVVPIGHKRALFKIEASGRLMLLIDHHKEAPDVQQALWDYATRHLRHQQKLDSWRKEKPPFEDGVWFSSVGPLVAMLKSIARGEHGPAVVEAMARSSASPQDRSPNATALAEDAYEREPLWSQGPNDPAEWQTTARRIRRGQGPFRDGLLAIYGEKCCVTGSGPRNVLQAAHIDEHAFTGDNALDNGLLLRSDIHDLFDDGLLSIHPETLKVFVSESLRSTEYWTFNGRVLRSPVGGPGPSRDRLRKRWDSKSP